MKYSRQIGSLALTGLATSALAAPFDFPDPFAPIESAFNKATSAVVSVEQKVTSAVESVATSIATKAVSVEQTATAVIASEVSEITGLSKDMPDLFIAALDDVDPEVKEWVADAAAKVEDYIVSTQTCSTIAGVIGHYGFDALMSGVRSGAAVPMALIKTAVACEAIMPINDANGNVNGANFTVGLNVPYKVEGFEVGQAICKFLNNELGLGNAIHSNYTDFDCWGSGCMTILTLKVHGPDAIHDQTLNDIIHFAGHIESYWSGCPNANEISGPIPSILSSLLPPGFSPATQVSATATEDPASSTDGTTPATDVPSSATDVTATATDEPATATDAPSSETDVTATATDEPATATDALSSETDEPATSTDEPATATDAPSSETEVGSSATEEAASSTTDLTPPGYGTEVPTVTPSPSASKSSTSARRSSAHPHRSSSASPSRSTSSTAQVTAPPTYA